MAIVATTQGRLLTQLEMTLFNRLAAKVEANFFSYSGGLGSMSTTLDFVSAGPAFLVKNSASYSAGLPFAPGMISYGEASGIAPALVVASSYPWPASLSSVHLDIKDSQGETRPAPIYFVATGSIGFLPGAPGRATGVLTTSTGATISGTFEMGRISPGLYTANASGTGAAAGFWVRVASDGSQVQDYLFDAAKPVGQRVPTPVDLGDPSDQVYLSLYGTGLRGSSSAAATVGGVSVPVYGFAPAGANEGEDVVNVGPLSRSLTGRGEVLVMLSFDNRTANTVTVNIH